MPLVYLIIAIIAIYLVLAIIGGIIYLISSLVAAIVSLLASVVTTAALIAGCVATYKGIVSLIRYCKGRAVVETEKQLPRQDHPDVSDHHYHVVSLLAAHGRLTKPQIVQELARLGISQLFTLTSIQELLKLRFITNVGSLYFPTELGVQFVYVSSRRGAFTPPVYPAVPLIDAPATPMEVLREAAAQRESGLPSIPGEQYTFEID